MNGDTVRLELTRDQALRLAGLADGASRRARRLAPSDASHHVRAAVAEEADALAGCRDVIAAALVAQPAPETFEPAPAAYARLEAGR